MAEKKQKILTAVFRDRANAQAAYESVRQRGYLDSEINVLMSDKTRSSFMTSNGGEKDRIEAGSQAIEGVGIGGAIGTAVGATLAAVAAIGTSLVVPGLGLVVAGPIVAALAGGGAGALTGGLIGGLVGLGIPEADAKAYQEVLRDGGVVIGVVPRNSDDQDKIEKDFRSYQGENVCYC